MEQVHGFPSTILYICIQQMFCWRNFKYSFSASYRHVNISQNKWLIIDLSCLEVKKFYNLWPKPAGHWRSVKSNFKGELHVWQQRLAALPLGVKVIWGIVLTAHHKNLRLGQFVLDPQRFRVRDQIAFPHWFALTILQLNRLGHPECTIIQKESRQIQFAAVQRQDTTLSFLVLHRRLVPYKGLAAKRLHNHSVKHLTTTTGRKQMTCNDVPVQKKYTHLNCLCRITLLNWQQLGESGWLS